MKFRITTLILFLISTSSYCSETVEQRIHKLEVTIKSQSDSLALYKAKVATIDLQRNFLSDIYNGNSAWFIGIVTLTFTALLAYSMYSNKEELKELEDFTDKKITELDQSLDLKVNNRLIEIENLRNKLNLGLKDLYFNSRIFYKNVEFTNNDLPTAIIFQIKINCIKSHIQYIGLSDSTTYNIDPEFIEILEVYNRSTDNAEHEEMLRYYIENIYNLDISTYKEEYKIYLKSKMEEFLININKTTK